MGDSTDSVRSQIAALAYADTHLGRLIDTLTSTPARDAFMVAAMVREGTGGDPVRPLPGPWR